MLNHLVELVWTAVRVIWDSLDYIDTAIAVAGIGLFIFMPNLKRKIQFLEEHGSRKWIVYVFIGYCLYAFTAKVVSQGKDIDSLQQSVQLLEDNRADQLRQNRSALIERYAKAGELLIAQTRSQTEAFVDMWDDIISKYGDTVSTQEWKSEGSGILRQRFEKWKDKHTDMKARANELKSEFRAINALINDEFGTKFDAFGNLEISDYADIEDRGDVEVRKVRDKIAQDTNRITVEWRALMERRINTLLELNKK